MARRGHVPTPTVQQIICAVANEFGITAEDITARCREPRYAHPRILAMQLARELAGASYPELGRAFSRHYSTILAAQKRAHDLIDAFPAYYDRRQRIIARLRSGGLQNGRA
jgi:chromosomal replication initiation ATPase DnaA